MSSTIKPKLDQQLHRQVSQHISERKSELNSRHMSELKNLSQSIKQSNEDKRAVVNAAHAVNHIKARSMDDSSNEETAPSKDAARLYTRQGKLEDLDEEDIVTNPDVESAAERLAHHREEKENKLQANEIAREDDSFYHVHDRGNTILEEPSGYFIDAYAPEHEKAGVRVSITHDKAIVSGSRKSENEEASPYGKAVTNNFQTFREEFKFNTPVEAKGMTRERIGDYIRFYIPKLGTTSEPTEES